MISCAFLQFLSSIEGQDDNVAKFMCHLPATQKKVYDHTNTCNNSATMSNLVGKAMRDEQITDDDIANEQICKSFSCV